MRRSPLRPRRCLRGRRRPRRRSTAATWTCATCAAPPGPWCAVRPAPGSSSAWPAMICTTGTQRGWHTPERPSPLITRSAHPCPQRVRWRPGRWPHLGGPAQQEEAGRDRRQVKKKEMQWLEDICNPLSFYTILSDILARPGSVSSGRNESAGGGSGGTLTRKNSAPGSMAGRPLPPTPRAVDTGKTQQRPMLGRSISLANPPTTMPPLSEGQQQQHLERKMSTASQPPMHLVEKHQQQHGYPGVSMGMPGQSHMPPPPQQNISFQTVGESKKKINNMHCR